MVARRNPVVPRRTVHVGDSRIPVLTTVTARPAVARRWLHTAVWLQGRRLRSGADLTVGLGVQWRPPYCKLPSGAVPRPATLQLCAGKHCLVFQIARAGAVPNILRRLLADARVLFAAYRAAYDRQLLRAHHRLDVASMVELRGAAGMGDASMEEMAAKLLGIRGARKWRSVGTGDWDAERLSPDQVRYACVDAYLSFRLGAYIRRLGAHCYRLLKTED
ncbi:hypothetical protein BS78_03G081500 [Paspalum vaginatum]|nr:hypothetical protein BS78_03G081500 [Paspalum vaginatum]